VTGIWDAVGQDLRLGVTTSPQADDAAGGLSDVEHAWEGEIRRRLAEIEAGTADLIPAEDVFAELRRRRAALEDDGDNGQPRRTVFDQI
jgi:hypothetical protein